MEGEQIPAVRADIPRDSHPGPPVAPSELQDRIPPPEPDNPGPHLKCGALQHGRSRRKEVSDCLSHGIARQQRPQVDLVEGPLAGWRASLPDLLLGRLTAPTLHPGTKDGGLAEYGPSPGRGVLGEVGAGGIDE